MASGKDKNMAEAELTQKISIELLRLCNKAESSLELMRSLTLFFQEITACEAVGVRLRDGDDFPYYDTRGFLDDFVRTENSLCECDQEGNVARDVCGNPASQCMCGNVICGRIDPSKPFFTARGSFWSGCISELLTDATDAALQARTLKRCNDAGFESVALIPIRFRDETIGLVQFNDKRRGCFTAEKIAWMEDLVDYVAIAVAKLRSDEALQRKEHLLMEAQEISCLGSYVYNIPGDRWTGTKILADIFGIDANYDRSSAGWGELVHPSQRAEMLTYLREVVELKRPFDKEYRIIRKNDGEERWVHMLGRLEYDAAGSPIRLVGSIQDITARIQAEEDLHNYARRLLEMEEELKKKLATELHDEIGRDLTALGINMTLIRKGMTSGDSKELQERISDSEKLIDGVRRTARNIMGSLRPPELDDLDLNSALTHHVNLFSQRTGISVSLKLDEAFPRLPAEKEMVLFRIVQESLTNIAKHAEARCVTITLRKECRIIRLSISDDGRGFTPPLKTGFRDGYGMGLRTMRERAEMIGGTFDLVTLPGSGTTVSVQIEDNRDAD